MDIVDSQIHFGPGGTEVVVAEMDALNIQACLVDEFWGLETWGPGYALPNGTFRPTRPTVEWFTIACCSRSLPDRTSPSS